MTVEPTLEEIAVEQRATDPRLDQQVPPVIEEITPIVDETVVEQEQDPKPIAETPPKPKKTAEEVLKGRVGHLTKTLNAKDQEFERIQAQLVAAQALLAANRNATSENSEIAPPELGPRTTQYTQADFEAAVAARTEAQDFNRRADEMYSDGTAKFPDWKDAVDTLVASGFMDKDLLDAAMAVDGGVEVLHHLGTNLDEAERIASLSPIKKAAEMSKLSSVIRTPINVAVSAAPAPIRPVSGSANPQIDLQRISDSDDMSSYIAARAKQGSRWAQGRK